MSLPKHLTAEDSVFSKEQKQYF